MLTIPEQLARQTVVVMESSIPGEMTIDQWRALRRRSRRPRTRFGATLSPEARLRRAA